MATKLTKAVEKNAGNDAITKMTFSAWIKRSKLGEAEIFAAHQLSSYYTDFYFNSDDALILYSYINSSTAANVVTKRTFVDTNAWYHIMLVVDTTLATTNDRIKFYVNGVRETEMDGSQTHPAQDAAFGQFSDTGATLCIGDNPNRTAFEGSMSHVYYVPYTAYDASYFGETDSTTGEWKIKTTPNVTYSTAGWGILKNGNSVTDVSGNSNNFTVASGTLTKTEDCPSNVFATLDILNQEAQSNGTTFSNGATTYSSGGHSNTRFFTTNIGANKGKFYCEIKLTALSAHNLVGISSHGITSDMSDFYFAGSGNAAHTGDNYEYGYKAEDGNQVNNASASSYGNTYTTNDIISIAMDLDNNKLYFGKNGTWQNSGDPTSGSTGTGAISITDPASTDTGFYFFTVAKATSSTDTATFQCNFGNGYFGTTAVASAGTNASNIGIFEYNVPTGYTALSTKGLNE